MESSSCTRNTARDICEKEPGECISDLELSDLPEIDAEEILVLDKSPQVICLVSDEFLSTSDKSDKICLEKISSDSEDFSPPSSECFNFHSEERNRRRHGSERRRQKHKHQKHKTRRKSSPLAYCSTRHGHREYGRSDKHHDDPRQRENRHRRRRCRSRSKEKCYRCDEFGKGQAADFMRRSKRSRDRSDDFEYGNTSVKKRRRRERKSKSPSLRRSKSPYLRRSKSPFVRRSRIEDPYLRGSTPPYIRELKSPYLSGSRSPHLRRSNSPYPRRSKSPYLRRSKSPHSRTSKRCGIHKESRRLRRMSNDAMHSSIRDFSKGTPNQGKTKKTGWLTSQERDESIPGNQHSPVGSPTHDTRSAMAPCHEARSQETRPEIFQSSAMQKSASGFDKVKPANNSESSLFQCRTEPNLKEKSEKRLEAAVPPPQTITFLQQPSRAGSSPAREPACLSVQLNSNEGSASHDANRNSVDSNDHRFPLNPTAGLFPIDVSISNSTVPANVIPSVSNPVAESGDVFSVGSTGKLLIPCFNATKQSKSILDPPSYSSPGGQKPFSNMEFKSVPDDGKQRKVGDEVIYVSVIETRNKEPKDLGSAEEEAKKKSPIMINIDSDDDLDSDISCPSIECLESSERNHHVMPTNPGLNCFSEPETSDDEGALQIVCDTPKRSPRAEKPETENKGPYTYEKDESLIKRVRREIERMSKERYMPYPLGRLILFEPLREPPKKDDPFESPLTRNRIELPFVKYGACDVPPKAKDPVPITFTFRSTGAYQEEREKRRKKKKDKNAESSNSRSKKVSTANVGIQCDLTSQVILKLNLKISQLKDVINGLEMMNMTAAVKREPKPEKE